MGPLRGVVAGAVAAVVVAEAEAEVTPPVGTVLPVVVVLLPAEASRLAPDRPDYRGVHAIGNLVRRRDGDRVESCATQT